MTNEYRILNRGNPDKEDLNDVPHPICPLNLYFEGDEDKCDVSKCDFDLETRSCSHGCRINVKELQEEVDRIKPQPKEETDIDNYTKGEWTIEPVGVAGNPNHKMIIGHPDPKDFQVTRTIGQLFDYGTKEENEANARLIAAAPKTKQQRDDLLEELANYKEGIEGLKLSIQDLRPYADSYKRVCESLGIEKDILGYVKKLTEQRDSLLGACKMALGIVAGERITNDTFPPKDELLIIYDKQIRECEKELETVIADVEKKGV